jgi:hypothetical protein
MPMRAPLRRLPSVFALLQQSGEQNFSCYFVAPAVSAANDLAKVASDAAFRKCTAAIKTADNAGEGKCRQKDKIDFRRTTSKANNIHRHRAIIRVRRGSSR